MQNRVFIRRYGWLVVLVCVAVPLIRWWAGRSRPERLSGGVPRSGLLEYSVRINPDNTFSILRQPLPSGAAREIGRVPLAEGSLQSLSPLTRIGDYVYFTLDQEHRPPQKYGFAGGVATVPQKPIVTHYVRKPDPVRARLCRVPCQGGPVQEVRRDLNTRLYAAVGDDIYWIRGKPEAVASVWDRTGMHETVTPKSDLMQTSLRTHTTRLIATGLPLYTPLFSGREAVYWTKYARPNAADAVSELWRYAPAQPAPQCIMQGYKDYKPPFEADGRLYWVSTDMGDSQIGGSNIPKNASLYSAKPDGSGRRLVLELVTDKRPKWAGYRFLTYDNRLYALLKDPPDTGPNSYISDLPTRLYRVREHATPMLRPIFKIPPKTYENVLFDRGYFYFTRHEEQEEWLHWSAPVQGKNVLYRFRLPED